MTESLSYKLCYLCKQPIKAGFGSHSRCLDGLRREYKAIVWETKQDELSKIPVTSYLSRTSDKDVRMANTTPQKQKLSPGD